MKKEIINDYKLHEEIVKHYDSAKNDAEKEAARNEMQMFNESVRAKSQEYNNMLKNYDDCMRRGNEYIDINDSMCCESEEELIERLRSYGVEKFTFSSTWSRAVESAWKFVENGCELEGLIQINGTNKDWNTGEYDRVPAYLFSIK